MWPDVVIFIHALMQPDRTQSQTRSTANTYNDQKPSASRRRRRHVEWLRFAAATQQVPLSERADTTSVTTKTKMPSCAEMSSPLKYLRLPRQPLPAMHLPRKPQ